MDNKPILIIGLTAQGLSLLRTLSRANCEVIAFYSDRKNVGAKSGYGDKRYFVDLGQLRREIDSLAEQYGNDLLCYITSGGALVEILTDFPDLWDLCDVISGPRETVSRMAHKDYLYQLAVGCDFIVPKYGLLSEYRQGSLRFPVFLKRNYEIPLFFKAAKADAHEQLEKDYIRRMSRYERENVIVQECIPINEHSMDLTAQSFYCDGKANEFFIGWQKRKTCNGLTSCLEELDRGSLYERIRSQCTKYMLQTDYTGFAEFEFIYDPDTYSLFFLEINTRPCGTQSVMDYKFSNLADVLLRPHAPPLLQSRTDKPVRWMNIVRDIRVRFQRKVFSDLTDIFHSQFDVLRKDDPMPFLRQFI